MNCFAGTRAEREWLSALRRIADALERISQVLESPPSDKPPNGEA